MLSLYENARSVPPRLRCGFFYSLVSHADNSRRIESGWDPLRILWYLLVWLGYILTQKPIITVPLPSWLSTPVFWANDEVALPFKETDLFVFNLFGTGLKLTVFQKCPHTSSHIIRLLCWSCLFFKTSISNTISHSQFEKKLLLMFSFL